MLSLRLFITITFLLSIILFISVKILSDCLPILFESCFYISVILVGDFIYFGWSRCNTFLVMILIMSYFSCIIKSTSCLELVIYRWLWSFYYILLHNSALLRREQKLPIVLKHNHQTGEIIHRLLLHRSLNHPRRNRSNESILLLPLPCAPLPLIPKQRRYFLITQLVINPIWAHHNEIMLLTIDLKIGNLRFGNEHLIIASEHGQFGLDIPEGPRDR